MMTTVTNRRLAANLKLSTALGFAMLTLTGTAALAQSVVVQGNRRVDAETSSPVQVITKQEIDQSGKGSVAEYLQTLEIGEFVFYKPRGGDAM